MARLERYMAFSIRVFFVVSLLGELILKLGEKLFTCWPLQNSGKLLQGVAKSSRLRFVLKHSPVCETEKIIETSFVVAKTRTGSDRKSIVASYLTQNQL